MSYDSELTVNGMNTSTPTAGIFATYPHDENISNGICLWVTLYLEVTTCFLLINQKSLDQVVGTAVLVFSILAVTDAKNKVRVFNKSLSPHFPLFKVNPSIIPIFIGLTIGAVGMSFGYNCGFSLNPGI